MSTDVVIRPGGPADIPAVMGFPDMAGEWLVLVTSRAHKGRGFGALLLDYARGLARERGIGLLRLDCYAGGDGKLVRYYQSQGFTVVRELHFGQWEGRLLQQRLATDCAPS